MIDKDSKPKKEKDVKLERIRKVSKMLDSIKYTQRFKLHDQYRFLAEDFIRSSMVLAGGTISRPALQIDEGIIEIECDTFRYRKLDGGNISIPYEGSTEELLEEMRRKINSLDYFAKHTPQWNAVATIRYRNTWESDIEKGILASTQGVKGNPKMFEVLKPEKKEPPVFYRFPISWHITLPKNSPYSSYHDVDSKELSLLYHLAGTIMGVVLSSHFDFFETSTFKEMVMRQLHSYINTGTIKLNKPSKIIISKPQTYPKPLLSLAENGYTLTWRYSRYCPMCGDEIGGCWCEPVSKSYPDEKSIIEKMLEQYCWNCHKDLIDHFLTQNFTKKFPKDKCKEELEEMCLEDWVMDTARSDYTERFHKNTAESIEKSIREWDQRYGQFFEVEKICQNELNKSGKCIMKDDEFLIQLRLHNEDYQKYPSPCQNCEFNKDNEYPIGYQYDVLLKKLKKEQLDAFWKLLSDFSSDDCGDPPEDMCDCPTWGG